MSKLRKQRFLGLQFTRLRVLQIADKAYHVGMLGKDCVDISLKIAFHAMVETPHMRITEEHNPHAIESFWQVVESKFNASDTQLTRAENDSVKHSEHANQTEQQADNIPKFLFRVAEPTAEQA